MFAVERYRQRQASLGKAAELAGVFVGRMMEILAEYGVESNLEHEDDLQGLQNLREAW
jgi:predicted HTH domain antitoxin